MVCTKFSLFHTRKGNLARYIEKSSPKANVFSMNPPPPPNYSLTRISFTLLSRATISAAAVVVEVSVVVVVVVTVAVGASKEY